jgi:hypothetical protein
MFASVEFKGEKGQSPYTLNPSHQSPFVVSLYNANAADKKLNPEYSCIFLTENCYLAEKANRTQRIL